MCERAGVFVEIEFILSHGSGGQSQRPRGWQGWFILEALREGLFSLSSFQRWPAAVVAPWFMDTSLQLLLSPHCFLRVSHTQFVSRGLGPRS